MTTLGRMGYALVVQVLLSGLFFALSHFYAFAAPLSVLLMQGLTFALSVALATSYAIGKRSLTPVIISHALIDVSIEPWLLLSFFQ
jgi:CAAX protease family protein